MKKRSPKAFYIGLLITFAFIVYALLKIDLSETIKTFKTVNPLWLAPLPFIQAGMYFFRAWRWRVISKEVGPQKLWPYFSGVAIGAFGNMVLPFRLGDLARVYVTAKKRGYSGTSSVATLVVERVMDVLSLLAVSSLAFFTIPTGSLSSSAMLVLKQGGVLLLSTAIAAFGVMLFMASGHEIPRRFFSSLLALTPRSASKTLEEKLELFRRGLLSIRGGKSAILLAALTAMLILTNVSFYQVAFPSIGLELSFPMAVLTLALIGLSGLIPSSPGFVGPYHAAVVLALGIYGFPADRALGVAVFIHFVFYVNTVVIGLVCLNIEGMSFSQIKNADSGANSI